MPCLNQDKGTCRGLPGLSLGNFLRVETFRNHSGSPRHNRLGPGKPELSALVLLIFGPFYLSIIIIFINRQEN